MTNFYSLNQNFHYQGIYSCPVCRHGKISGMAMMDAFACNFCNNIFTANLEEQILKKADSQPPLMWHWNGKNWSGAHRPDVNLGWDYVVVAIAFILFPTATIGISAYLFPPLPGDPLYWFPVFWTFLTFLVHLSCVVWLMIEYYQFPVSIYFKAVGRHFWGRLRRKII
ncbi:MAG: hypothetical protein SAJ37_12200 [Oscillatoria sp. PMC 1068.18]|nr:hypothetical protein [Oscillatoria sp. PMC 1076.18]MEC4989504.1 hypothetical protein [Oscillatoria sp. PMC 1068.18]